MARTRKVFGIGFQKTGTTSLGTIFDALGYSSASYHQFRHLAGQEGITMEEITKLALEIAAGIDAAKDTPWPLVFKELDAAFPGAKFIHVTRNPDAWIKSAVKDFGDHPNAIHTAIYGTPCPVGHEDVWLARYAAHNAEVAEYFKDRPEDCLFLNLEDGVSYEAVCDFLGEERVGQGVPVANTRLRKKIKMAWWRLTGQG